MGISVIGPPLEGTIQEQEYRRVFEAMVQDHADALLVGDQGETLLTGGLMAYATDLLDLNRRAAGYVGQILRGAKPSEMPIYLATKFELVIDVKAAKAIGLAILPTLVARADEVIE